MVCDLLEMPNEEALRQFDVVVLELGVLHYFVDLQPVFKLVREILISGGIFVLRDYHPMVSKLLLADEGKMVAKGNYFENNIVEVEVAFWRLLEMNEQQKWTKNMIRRWTLGEIVTSLADAGMHIKRLDEESGIKWAFPANAPEAIEDKVPGLFTIISEKA